MIDNRKDIEIPEGLTLPAHPAGPVVRLYAWLIDLLIRGAIILGVIFILSFFGEMGWGLAMIVMFTLEWFYPVLFEVLRDGTTPGKRTFQLKVIHDDLTPISWQASILRNLLRSIDFLPLFYLFGLISMLLNSEFKRLGDLAAGTLVIYSEQGETSIPEIDQPAAAPNWPLQPNEQQAILNFAQRHTSMTRERSEELANLTQPLVDSNNHPIKPLLAIAQWIIGKRIVGKRD